LSAQWGSCEADIRSVEVALQAYNAQHGSYPTPPAPWSAANYATDYSPLHAYLLEAPKTAYYVVEYDQQGNVWVAPPGSYGKSYNPAQGFDKDPNGVCLAAVR
jgi:hypothetical protein